MPAVLEQKVTGKEAFSSWRRLVRRYGEPAPGAGGRRARRLLVLPTPRRLRSIPSWEWLQLHVDPARSRTVVTRRDAGRRRSSGSSTCRSTRPTGGCGPCPGVGVWTSAEVRARALGDADAVSFGDYHVAKDIGWALTGGPSTTQQLERAARAVPRPPVAGPGAGRAGGAAPAAARAADDPADPPPRRGTGPALDSSARGCSRRHC